MNNENILELDVARTERSLTSLKNAVLQALNEKKLYRSNHLYRGFDSRFVEHVLYYGTENPADWGIYTFPESHLSIDPDPRWINPLHYARASGALAVYSCDRLKLGFNCIDWYEFVDQTRKNEAVVAVILFKEIASR